MYTIKFRKRNTGVCHEAERDTAGEAEAFAASLAPDHEVWIVLPSPPQASVAVVYPKYRADYRELLTFEYEGSTGRWRRVASETGGKGRVAARMRAEAALDIPHNL